MIQGAVRLKPMLIRATLGLIHVCCWLMVSAAPYQPRITKSMEKWNYGVGNLDPRLWVKNEILGGLAYSNPASLHGLLRKLSAGQPIKVVAFGSSVTADLGGCWGSADMVAKHVPVPSESYNSIAGYKCNQQKGWLRYFMAMINSTWPHPEHLLINNGVPARTAHAFAFASCLEDGLPKEADLIIFEQLVQIANPIENKGLDHLIWRLKNHFSGVLPPFVLIQSRKISESPDISRCLSNSTLCSQLPECLAITPSWFEPQFYEGDVQWQEDFLNRVAIYYGLAASFSVLDWYHAALEGGLPRREGLSECEFLSRMFGDTVHPTSTGRMLLTDWLTALMIKAETSLSTCPDPEPSAGGDVYARKFPNVSLVPKASRIWRRRCYGVIHEGTEQTGPQARLQMSEGSHGWEFVDYQINGEVKKYKPGWVAVAPHSTLLVKVDSLLDSEHPEVNAAVAVSYLRSYEHMGMANVSCYSGCQCDGMTLDGNWEERASQTTAEFMKLSQHKECVLQIVVLDSSNSPGGEHKFKIDQLMIVKAETI